VREQVREDFGFNDPIHVQYLRMMEKTFDGSLESYSNRVNVREELIRGIPATASLVIGGAIIWLFFGILFGVISAVYAGRFPDRVITIAGLIGISLPVFWVGAMLLYYLTYKVSLFPAGGYVPLSEDPASWLSHMILPWFTISLVFIGFYSRLLRSNMLDVMNEDYVRTARAKGVSPRLVDTRHVLRNALLPIATIIGLQTGLLLSGAVLTETVFAWPGLGTWLVNAIRVRDFPVLQGGILFVSVVFVLVNLFVDVMYAVINPRIRYS
jgi:peptide/nickel transport system permease protein